MNNIWKNILVALALSAIFATTGSYFLYTGQLKITKLDLHQDFDANYFSKPKFPSNKIILTVDDIEKDKLGLFKISLVNFTTENYENIPINIKVTPKNKNEFKILGYSAVGQEELYDLVKETKKKHFDGSSHHFSYNVSSINRTEKSNYGMQLRILFEGRERV
ncbi:hypothetical protein D5018_20560 [Parashewanella curva]|uniref:Uncharacterized protein n=1 Tax=Parashewanella curva TaxID=2338552 RepID=A0A3L8PR10_9GAMM|nr:hypothetical protein [Parashewanella curva]RLV57817.1 hypothetical protein D5018_20560 [Parashewanella curva]